MARRRYLISYDISDDKRRTHVFKALRDNGDHVQFSVFFCELNEKELVRLRMELDEAINHRQDQIVILDLGGSHIPLESALVCLGKAYNPPSRVLVV